MFLGSISRDSDSAGLGWGPGNQVRGEFQSSERKVQNHLTQMVDILMSHKPQAGRAHNLLPTQQNTFSHRVVQGPLAQNRLGWVGSGREQQILAGKAGG